MKTVLEKINLENNSLENAVFNKAANILKSDGLVAFPTETVYGLGANALSYKAVKKIYKAKGRPSDNPLIVHISDISEIQPLVKKIPNKAKILIEEFFPGPLTIVFEKSELIPKEVCCNLNTVAIRMPINKIARNLIKNCGFPIAAPSANTSGKPSPTLAKHVLEDLDGKIDMIIDGGMCSFGVESTVIDVTREDIYILRPGSITKKMIENKIGKVYLDKAIISCNNNETPKSPGLKYKHYSPKGDIIIFKGNRENVKNKINKLLFLDSKNGINSLVIATEQTKNNYNTNNIIIIGDESNLSIIVKNLYDCLRKCDEKKVEKIYIESFTEEGIGFTIMNRLKKAAGNNIVKV